MPISISGTNGITLDGQFNSASSMGFKNRILNGGMVIDQRNAGASVTPTASGYTLDRWQCLLTQASKFSIQQSTTVPSGFKNSIAVTSLSAFSVAASDYFDVQQQIEGLNVFDLGWGSASAATVTLSFQVRSSLTGTFGGALTNSDGSRSYPFTYTISSANTFESKSITIAGDTSGTWLTTNGTGITLRFGLGVGSTFSGTAGSWSANNYVSATGAISVVGTNGATFYITGVQLEKGSTATSFDYRPYGTELGLCYRYFYKWQAGTSYAKVGFGRAYSTTNGAITTYLPQPMRSTPTGSYSSLSHFDIAGLGNPTALTIPDGYSADYRVLDLNFTKSGATTGVVYQMEASNTTSAYLTWSAEL